MAFPKEERDELRRLHAAATAGEWHYDDGVTDGEGTPDAERGKAAWITAKGNVLIAEPSGCDPKEPCVPSLAEMDANGKCIVATHNALIPLLDALDAAEECDALKAKLAYEFEASEAHMRNSLEWKRQRDAARAKLAALVEALSKIARPTYGTELHDTDAERAHVYWQHIERFQRTAQQALVAAQVQP